jgi:glycosyltransferase involved in cell wall biosynthesis
LTLSVVHFSTADTLGGSARSAYRIHSGLRQRGHRSRMLVGFRTSTDADVDTVSGGSAMRRLNRLVDVTTRRFGYQYVYFPSTQRVLAHPWIAEAQVFQIYNTHGGYFATGMLPELSARAPLVWRLSDMWPLTGHCAYAAGCERWRTGCGECPDLGTYPPVGADRTAQLWRMKEAAYARSRITVVAPSSWIERLAKESPLLGRFPVYRIPNGIDLARFAPRDPAALRATLGIEPRTRVILFTAHGLDANARKGSDDAIEALRCLGRRRDTVVLLAGEGGDSWQGRLEFPLIRVGFVHNEEKLAAVYGAADLLLAPSRSENLPNNVLEAIASGVPVVAYAAGGMEDAVRHLETGWLAAIGSVEGLAQGMRRILDEPELRARLGTAARALAEAQFDQADEVKRFERLYLDLVRH